MPPSYDRDTPAFRDAERVQMAMAAGAIVGTWFWDVVRDRLSIDEPLAQAFGLDPALPRENLRVEQVVATVHPDDQAGLAEAINAALAHGGRYVHQYRALSADGGYRWLEAVGRVDLDADGRALRFPGVLIDIGERRRLESERDQARSLLDSFTEAVPGVVYAKDRQGRLLIGNRGTTELIGRPPEAYIGRTDAEVLADPAQAAAVMAADARVMASGQTEQLEEEVSFPDGRRAWWLSTKAPLRDESGAVVGLVGTSLDITSRKTAEQRHREIEERYRLAAQATNDAIWDWRMVDGHVIWNEALRALFGHDITQTSAQWWIEHIHPDDRARIDAAIHAVIEGGGSAWTGEYRFRRADGSYASVFDRGTVLRDAAGAPVRMIGAMLDLTARKRAEAALAEREERLRLATDAGDLGFWDVDLAHDQLIWPARTKAMFGIPADAPVSLRDFYDGLHPDDREATSAAFAAAADPARRALYDVEYRTVGKEDGVVRWVAAKGRGLFDEDRCVRVVGVAIDITARKAAEAQLKELNERLEARVAEEVAGRLQVEEALRQAQKMEAVGQLTGGIAHDFNNMLATVIGPLDALARRLGDADPRNKRYVDLALDGATRAAQLTQRLLAFSRQQPLQPVALDPNRLVSGMSGLLAHSLGSSVRLETVLAGGIWWISADENQLENVILNLAVNARDAMPDGGRLTVETANCDLDHRYAADNLGVQAGQYVLIAVTDTGAGMPPEVMAKAFDPFFTTKEVGRGTGLGLSQVYGFVKQSAGHVKIYSEVGQGTTVKVYLPRLLRRPLQVSTEPVRAAHALPLGESQDVVLVVEDEPAVREFSVQVLTDLGYRVLEADGADAALQLLAAHPDISLLFTDVIMPGLNGRQLADRARESRPDLKVLFTTGYSRNAVVHNGVLDPGVHLIGKPFTAEELAQRVRAVIDGLAPLR
ncbi:PAS domain-containing protein [Luteimonas kalidii]|uniref:histidine kinase n=1 Tax=Luteimonas kalidii TaxID=3042025 RepID=A0ABT6JW56_9GAMM|nr:PAS domain-containing protein [Luteimonas kalidii]MDH5834824.1 PAS domain-containing protein [Luteimonas kalidii]